jgi:hypothetical protein
MASNISKLITNQEKNASLIIFFQSCSCSFYAITHCIKSLFKGNSYCPCGRYQAIEYQEAVSEFKAEFFLKKN